LLTVPNLAPVNPECELSLSDRHVQETVLAVGACFSGFRVYINLT